MDANRDEPPTEPLEPRKCTVDPYDIDEQLSRVLLVGGGVLTMVVGPALAITYLIPYVQKANLPLGMWTLGICWLIGGSLFFVGYKAVKAIARMMSR